MKFIYQSSLLSVLFVRITFLISTMMGTAALAASANEAPHTENNTGQKETKTAQKEQESTVTLKTSMGDITIQLHPSKAPRSVANFLQYVKEGFYDGVIFHRVIPDFMVQTGGMLPSMQKKPGREPILNESINGLPNLIKTVAMARTGDPDSATSQFYINVVDNHYLNSRGGNPGYTVFATVIEGFDVALAISKQERGARDVPKKTIMLTKAVLNKPTINTAKLKNTLSKKEASTPIKTISLKKN